MRRWRKRAARHAEDDRLLAFTVNRLVRCTGHCSGCEYFTMLVNCTLDDDTHFLRTIALARIEHVAVESHP